VLLPRGGMKKGKFREVGMRHRDYQYLADEKGSRELKGNFKEKPCLLWRLVTRHDVIPLCSTFDSKSSTTSTQPVLRWYKRYTTFHGRLTDPWPSSYLGQLHLLTPPAPNWGMCHLKLNISIFPVVARRNSYFDQVGSWLAWKQVRMY
jgi:hypothetical protein